MKFKKKVVPVTTGNITKAIINYLLYKGHGAWRINTQGQWDEQKQIWRKSGAKEGFFDICCAFKRKSGNALFGVIEVKNKLTKDTMKKGQKKFMEEVDAVKGIRFIAPSYDEFVSWFENEIEPNL